MAKRNGTKTNGPLIAKIGIWFVAIVFTAGGVYVAVHYRLNAVEGDVKHIEAEEIPKLEVDIDACDDKVSKVNAELVGIKKDIGYLDEKVDRNFRVQEQILDEIKELHK